MHLAFSTQLARLFTFSALGLGLLLGSGCSKTSAEEKDVLTSNDFDHLDGWVGDVPSLTREKAHSGAYSIVVQPGIEYGLGYSNPLGRLSTMRPDKIRISAWVMRTGDQNAAKLVAEIKDPATGAKALWEAIDLGKEVPKLNEWKHIEHVITVPPTVSATSRIMVYMWGAGAGQPTYLDDLTLSQVAK
ncbi:hypothetical protein GKZ68_17975 [Hymenobacter sp. BRD128]|uniref:hypothetical protein n=1 Tax=Hymenobacter sp. BRD128 TaxID=2675878 RepID=UPI00156549DD|nr:hypothetical protein [Hymenobacter sp. BRD128]QKG58350.1 hypothetical protein GKZ68_17975 [Hymenobacter sp. BRD128]